MSTVFTNCLANCYSTLFLGKVAGDGSDSKPSANTRTALTPDSRNKSSEVSNGGAPQLAGLLAGGMPKLRTTGRLNGSSLHNSSSGEQSEQQQCSLTTGIC